MSDTTLMTPEERLFKLVEAGGQVPAGAGAAGAGGGALKPPRWPTIKFTENFRHLGQRIKEQPLHWVNQTLFVLLGLLAVYLAFDLLFLPKRLKVVSEIPAPAANVREDKKEEGFTTTVPIDEFISVVKQRDVFRPPGSTPTPSQAPADVSPLQSLKLVGIAWGGEPEAMIVDTSLNRTFFLKAGEKIHSLTVEKVNQDSVLLRPEKGEVLELR